MTNELAHTTTFEGELLSDDCSLGYSVCTNRGVQLVEDPDEADVNNTPRQMILVCPECLNELALDI